MKSQFSSSVKTQTMTARSASLFTESNSMLRNPSQRVQYFNFRKAVPVFLLLLSSIFWNSANAQIIVNTVAGNGTSGYTGDGGSALSAEMGNPVAVTIDGAGNVYIALLWQGVVRKVSASGIISTVAGNGTLGFSGDGGAATNAELYGPWGVCVDASGNIYIADQSVNVIRKVNTSGIISTYAGTPWSYGYTGDGGAATAAQLGTPTYMGIDGSGNLYVSEIGNDVIRKINYSTHIITTFAGNGTIGYGGDGAAATAAELNYPSGIAADGAGNVYIGDELNGVVRVVNSSGTIGTFAGGASCIHLDCGDGGPATAATLDAPFGLALDPAGDLFIADGYNNVIREVNTSGIINNVSGYHPGDYGYAGDGGPAIDAKFADPYGIAVDGSGNIFIADWDNFVVREIASTAAVCQYGTNTLSSLSTTGTWSSGNTAVATVGASTSVVTGVAPGTATISYTEGSETVTMTVIVNSPGEITGTGTICAVSSAIILEDAVPGGTWSSGNTSVVTVGSTSGEVTSIAGGTATVSYTLSSGCYATTYVTVIPQPQGCIYSSLVSGSNYEFDFSGTTDAIIYYNEQANGTTVYGTANLSSGDVIIPISSPAYEYQICIDSVSLYGCFWEYCTCSGPNGCCATIDPLGGSRTTGIASTSAQAGTVSLVPNPNNGVFSVKGATAYMASAQEVEIDVIDMLGQTVIKENAPINNGSINKEINLGNNIANGVYGIKVSTPDGGQVLQFTLAR